MENEGRDFISQVGREAVAKLIEPELKEIFAAFRRIDEKTGFDPATKSTAIQQGVAVGLAALAKVYCFQFGWAEIYSRETEPIVHSSSWCSSVFIEQDHDSFLTMLAESVYRQIGTERYETICVAQRARDNKERA